MRLVSIDGLRRQNQLQRSTFPDQAGQALRAAKTRYHPQLNFRLAEPRILGGQTERTRHRDLASPAEGEPVDRGDDGLAKVLDQIEDRLAPARELGGLDSGDTCDLRDVGTSHECSVAGAREDDASNGTIIARILQG